MFSNTLSFLYSRNVNDQVSHPIDVSNLGENNLTIKPILVVMIDFCFIIVKNWIGVFVTLMF